MFTSLSWSSPGIVVSIAILSALSGAISLLAVLAWMLRTRADSRRSHEVTELQTEVERLRSENRSTIELAVGTTHRLQRAEEQLRQLNARLDSMQVQGGTADSAGAYDQAIRLVRRGADPRRLVDDLGLSRAEAELMALVHGQRQAG